MTPLEKLKSEIVWLLNNIPDKPDNENLVKLLVATADVYRLEMTLKDLSDKK